MSGIRIPQTNMDLEPIDPLAPGIVDNGDLAAMPAFTLKGNNTGVSAAPQDIPIDDVLEDIEPYIDINATLVELAGIIGRAAITGDVTIAAGSNAATIPNGTVTNAKRADMAQSTISGRAAGAGTGAPTDLSVSQAQTVLADGWAYISFAGTVPASGLLRVAHNSTIIKVKDSGGTDRDFLVFGDSTDEVSFGLRNVSSRYWLSMQTGGFAMFFGTSNFFSMNNTRIELKRAELRWQNDVTTALAYVQNASAGAGQPLMVRAGGTTAASAAGGTLRLQAGRPGSGGTAGEVRLEGNRDDSTFDVALRARSSGSAAQLGLYNTTPVSQQTDVGAAPTDTVANLAAWCETVRTRLRNLGVTA